MSKIQNPDSRIWDIFSLAAISSCLIIFLIQWPQLPFFLDMYYHLAVAKGFDVAGGVVGHNFWEYGPEGAPHLYPPIIHLLILGLLKAGLGEITTLRLFSVLMPVLFLATLWHVIKSILTKKTAFFVVFLSLCCSLFMVSLSFTPAATLGMVLILWGLYAIYKNHIYSSILIFGMTFYVHTGTAVISMIFLILVGAVRIIGTKKFVKLFFFSLLIGSPWSFHIIRNLSRISYGATATMPLRLYPVILTFFIVGVWTALKKIKVYKIFIALLLSLIPMGLLYPFRLLCAQGAVGLLIFSGIGLERSYSSINGLLKKNRTAKKYTVFFLLVFLLYLIFFAPAIQLNQNGAGLNISDSLLTSMFAGKEGRPEHIISSSMFSRPLFNRLAEYVESSSGKGEFIWSNYRYLAGVLWAMTQRPSLSYMLREIRPKIVSGNIHNAALLIIIDEPKGELQKICSRLKCGFSFDIKRYEKREDADIYILINKNKAAVATYDIPPPLVNTYVAYIILAAYILVIIMARTREASSRQKVPLP